MINNQNLLKSEINHFSGIGSRSTPKSIIPIIEQISSSLINDYRFILRSGGADGADTFWENAYDSLGGQKEIYLPWKGFNNNSSSLCDVCDNAMKIASKFHPAWDRLGRIGKLLITRNTYQLFGKDFKYRSNLIICWTPGGKEIGGTAQCLRMGKHFNIPIFNLAIEKDFARLESHLMLNYGIL